VRAGGHALGGLAVATNELAVSLNGMRVGKLERRAHGVLRFTYGEDWLDHEHAIPISLSLPLAHEPYFGGSLECYLDNLLPDRTETRRRMATHLGAPSSQIFDLLVHAGADCIGALSFHDPELEHDVRKLDMAPVSAHDIGEALAGLAESPLGMRVEADDFRISIAGAQEKTAFTWAGEAWHRPRGMTPTTHIFKPPIGPTGMGPDLSDSHWNELVSLRLAEALGLETAQAEVHSFEGTEALVVERFDRRWARDESWITRLPQEDFCQALGVPSARKYESDGGPGMLAIFEVLNRSTHAQEDRASFFKSMVVFWLLAATDGHAKNFALFLGAAGRFHSTPLYDVTSAHPYIARGQLPRQKAKLAMAVLGKNRHYRWHEITRRHWLSTAEAARLPAGLAESILTEFREAVPGAISQVQAQLPRNLPASTSDPIFEGLEETARKL